MNGPAPIEAGEGARCGLRDVAWIVFGTVAGVLLWAGLILWWRS